MRNKNILKWVVYSLAVMLLTVIQGTPHALPAIAGTLPLLVIPLVISIAMFEGVTAGAVFGILGGLIWDLEGGREFGFNALFLMIFCIAAALLIENLFRNTIVSALVFCLISTFIIEVITWFFFIYLKGNEQFVFAFYRIILPTVVYSSAFMIPFYFAVRQISRKLTKKD